MKLLLDECLPLDLRRHIVGHDVFTVRYMKWSGLLNGHLLERAAVEGFDAFITSDRAIEREQKPRRPSTVGRLPAREVQQREECH